MSVEGYNSSSQPDIYLELVLHRPSRVFLLRRYVRADAGFYLSTDEPIRIPAEKKEEIAAAFRRWSSVPMRVVPTPKRDEYPKVTEHRLVGEKTYRAFVRNCAVRSLSRTSERVEILRYSPEPSGGGFLFAEKVNLPPDTTFEMAFERMWGDIIAEE